MKTLWKSRVSFNSLDLTNEICRKLEATYRDNYFLSFKKSKDSPSDRDRYGIFSYDRFTNAEQEIFEAYLQGYFDAIEGEEWSEDLRSDESEA